MTPSIPIRPSDDVVPVLSRLRRVVVPTDETGDGLALARRAATELAAEHGWELVLYDRSHERWIDTPHPSGPFAREQLDPDERSHLARQMAEIETAGVPVTAWLATVPSLTAMIDVIREVDVDGVLVPAELDDAKLMDRLLPGGRPADVVERVTDLQLPGEPPAFLVVDNSGHVTVAAYEGAES